MITLWSCQWREKSGLLWGRCLSHGIILYSHFAVASYSILTQYWANFDSFVPIKHLDPKRCFLRFPFKCSASLSCWDIMILQRTVLHGNYVEWHSTRQSFMFNPNHNTQAGMWTEFKALGALNCISTVQLQMICIAKHPLHPETENRDTVQVP